MLIFKIDCSSHRDVNLILIFSAALAPTMLHCLTPVCESNVHEQQSKFCPDYGCIEHMFALRRLLGTLHTHWGPTITDFLDLKVAFDSADQTALLNVLHWKDVPQKFANLLGSLYMHAFKCLRVYDKQVYFK